MSYRSIKRILGETNLERKCFLLFGVCLLVLVTGAFWWVDRIAENLVIETTRSKGRDLVDIALLKVHFPRLDTREEYREFVEATNEDLKAKDYDVEVLTLDGRTTINHINAKRPGDAEEREILQYLAGQVKKQEDTAVEEGPPAAPDGEPAPALAADGAPRLFADRRLPGSDRYDYYSPIRWRRSCRSCHFTLFEAGAAPASEGGAIYGEQRPLHVAKVAFSYKDTQLAINKTRSILIAVAIMTVFVAMIGLYAIVRYVIVKPLKHLRDVSDDISRGKTELRAVLNTGDEFEELAASFNRMLRHLTDTQAELRQVNKDLDAKVDQLAQLNMRLHEMNQLKSDFLANMSHELRTPLNSIIGFSDVLQGIDTLNGKQKRYAENIQKSGRMLLEMINDILDLAKMEAGKMEVRPTEFDIAKVVHAHCDMVRALSEEKNIDLEVQVQTDVPPMFQDQAKLQQILTNLLSNAIKFTPEGGCIAVSAQADEQGRLELIVADTGVGIAEEDQEVVFDKFRQGAALLGEDNLTREYSGTGLGLSIVRELCKLLGGQVRLQSELGKGSTFTVTLPWVCAEPARRETEISSKLDELSKPLRSELQGPEGVGRPPAAAPVAPSAVAVGDRPSDD